MSKGKVKGASSKEGWDKLAPIFITKKKAGAAPPAAAGATSSAAEESAAAPPKLDKKEIEQKGVPEKKNPYFRNDSTFLKWSALQAGHAKDLEGQGRLVHDTSFEGGILGTARSAKPTQHMLVATTNLLVDGLESLPKALPGK